MNKWLKIGALTAVVGLSGYFLGSKRMESVTVNEYIKKVDQNVFANLELSSLVSEQKNEIGNLKAFNNDLNKWINSKDKKKGLVTLVEEVPEPFNQYVKEGKDGNKVVYLPSDDCEPKVIKVDRVKVEKVVRAPTAKEIRKYMMDHANTKRSSKIFDQLRREAVNSNTLGYYNELENYFRLADDTFPLEGDENTPNELVFERFVYELFSRVRHNVDRYKGKSLSPEELPVAKAATLALLKAYGFKKEVVNGSYLPDNEPTEDDFDPTVYNSISIEY